MGPGIPKDRVEAVRHAYEQSLKDPALVAAITCEGLDIDPIGADELADIVHGIYQLPQAAVDGARELFPAP